MVTHFLVQKYWSSGGCRTVIQGQSRTKTDILVERISRWPLPATMARPWILEPQWFKFWNWKIRPGLCKSESRVKYSSKWTWTNFRSIFWPSSAAPDDLVLQGWTREMEKVAQICQYYSPDADVPYLWNKPSLMTKFKNDAFLVAETFDENGTETAGDLVARF